MHFVAPFLDFVQALADMVAGFTATFGMAGVAVFILVYILIVLFFLPITPFSMAAGALYGWWGVPIAFAGALSGALISFAIARAWGRGPIARICHKRPLVRTLERTLTNGGGRLVLLVRLSGLLPFSVQNYSFGLTDVSWRGYLWASALGLMPGALLKAWIGKSGFDVVHNGAYGDVLNTFGLLAALSITAVMLFYAGLLAAKELRAEGILDEETVTVSQ